MKTISKPMILRVLFICILCISFLNHSNAQFKSVTIGIDGLTCSMCTNSVEKLIRQLDFVADVEMDLNSTTAVVTFHSDKKVRVSDLAKKVSDAGFSVRALKAMFNFDNVDVQEGERFQFAEDEYVFLKTTGQKLIGESNITFIGKNYMSKKEFAQWKNIVAKNKGTSKTTSQIYHLIL